MLKKLTTTKQDQKNEAEIRAQFATDVIELYNATMAGKKVPHPDPDVRAVAYGLVSLKQLIEQKLREHRNDDGALVATGILAADEIITALTTTGRRAHPLWKHIESLKGSKFRATSGAQRRREIFAGIALAYQQAAGGDLRPATVAVCEGIQAKDFPVKSETLRKWVERNKGPAQQYANQFLADARAIGGPAGALPRCVIIVGRKVMRRVAVIPS